MILKKTPSIKTLQQLYLRRFPNKNEQLQEKTTLLELELLLSGSKPKLLLQQGQEIKSSQH